MRRRNKYYYIETFVYEEGCMTRKNYYFFIRKRDFWATLSSIIEQNPSITGYNSEFIRNACILNRNSSLYERAHEELSKANSEGYLSTCVFYEFGKE